METNEHAKHTPKTRTQFHSILAHLSKQGADREEWAVLVLGGTKDDVDTLQKLGFKNISLTNLASAMDPAPAKNTNGIRHLAVDAEDMGLPDNSYDLVFAHEVLHHCRSPHRAVCEMLRVSRRHIIFLEPNDSAFMRALVRMGSPSRTRSPPLSPMAAPPLAYATPLFPTMFIAGMKMRFSRLFLLSWPSINSRCALTLTGTLTWMSGA